MRRSFLVISVFIISLRLVAQDNLTVTTKTIYHRVGNTSLQLEVTQYGERKNPVFISLHDDEITAVNGAKSLLNQKGGMLIRLVNGGQRNLAFVMNRRLYRVDPNRIFSRKGIIESMQGLGRINYQLVNQLQQFAARIIKLFPAKPTAIIALHNNTDGRFSIKSFLRGGERAKDAAKVRIVDGQDEDDIFLTTDSKLYNKLIEEPFNVVLQNNYRATRDGSLSIYCGEKKIRYVNCETEHDKLSQYEMMMTALGRYIYD